MSDAETPPAPGDMYSSPLGAGLDLADPHSPFARYYVSTSQVVFGLLLVLLFLFINLLPLWHSDVWGHTKLGSWILDHREFPATEPFSTYTDKSQRLSHSGWLAQVTYAAVFRLGDRWAGGSALRRLAGGVELLRFLHQLLTVAAVAVLGWAYRRAGGSWRSAVLALVVFLLLALALIVVQRPQAFGHLAFAALIAILVRPIGWRSALVGVPAIVVAWANFHGSFVLGPVLLVLTTVGRGLESFSAGGPRNWRFDRDGQTRRLLAALVCSIAAVAVLNPHGPRLFLIVAGFGGHPNIPSALEWQPVRFSWGPGGHRACGILIAMIVITQLLSPRPFTPTQWLWVSVFGVGPFLQQRMFIWWAMIVPAVLLPHWVLIVERLDWRWLKFRSQPDFRKTVVLLVLLVCAAMTAIPVHWLTNRGPRLLDRSLTPETPWRLAAELSEPGLSPRPSPVLRDLLARHYPNGELPGPILCSETVGDYLFWAMKAPNEPLACTHIHLFPPDYWRDFILAMKFGEGFRAFADRMGANLIVVEPGLVRIVELLRADPDWIVIDDPANREPNQRRALVVALRRKPISSK